MIMVLARSNDTFAQIDCSLAAENMMIAARSLGIGSCWIGVAMQLSNDRKTLTEIGVPSEYNLVAPLIFGYPTKMDQVVEIIEEIVFGEPEEVLYLLGANCGGRINTSYVERLNLSIRNSLARFIRRGMNFSKDPEIHSKAIDFFQAWYNFVKPHKSLRLEHNYDNRKWVQRTPAMAERLTDHIWPLRELLCFRVPIQ